MFELSQQSTKHTETGGNGVPVGVGVLVGVSVGVLVKGMTLYVKVFEINGGHPLLYCVMLKYIVGGKEPGIVTLLGDEQPPALLIQFMLSIDQLIEIVVQGPVTVKYNKNVFPLLFNTVTKDGATHN